MTVVGTIVMALAKAGFQFRLEGKTVKMKFAGPAGTDLDHLKPLLAVIKAHKDEVREFLRIYCPYCGGVVFWGDETGESKCLKCEPPC